MGSAYSDELLPAHTDELGGEAGLPPGARWTTFTGVGLALFMATFAGSSLNVALPTLLDELNTDLSGTAWVITGYLLVVGALLLPVGRLADRYGRRPVYLAGLALFVGGVVICGLSDGVATLAAGRMVQAVGASATMSCGPAALTAGRFCATVSSNAVFRGDVEDDNEPAEGNHDRSRTDVEHHGRPQPRSHSVDTATRCLV